MRGMSAPTPEVLALLEATFDAVVIMDDRGRIQAFNASAEEMFGYRAADAIGRNVSMLMTAADRLEHDDHLKRYLAGGEARVLGKGRDVRVRHRDGSEFSVFLSVGRIPNTDPPQFVGFLHDTSLRRKALATLEKERQLNRLYLDLAQVMLVATDRNGVVQLVNQRAIRVLKQPSDGHRRQQLGRRAASRREDRAAARTAFRALLMSGGDEPQGCEYHVRSSDGEDRFITWRGVALRDADNVATGVMLSGEDITDQRRAESEAHRALERMNSVSRLATMGEMAAGISHELNQPLAAIANYAQACVRMLRMPAPDLPEIAGALEQISGQALRAGEIIRRIRSLVRNEDVRRETQDINELIREVHGLLASDARVHDGKLALDLADAAADGHGGRRADPAGAHEPRAQRVRGAGERKRRSRRRAVRSAHRHAPDGCGRRRSVGQRSRPGTRGRRRTEDLRAILHHQGHRAPALASRSAARSSRRTTRGSGIAPISRAAHASTSSFRPTRRAPS